MSDEIKVYTLNEACNILGITRATMRKIMKQQGFPASKIGGQWMILKDDLLEWIRQQKGGVDNESSAKH